MRGIESASGIATAVWVFDVWQAGLTVSTHAQVVASEVGLASHSSQAITELFVLAKACGDSLPAFATQLAVRLKPAQKCKVEDRFELIPQTGIRFR